MTRSDGTINVLVVEDDPDDARIIFRALRRGGTYKPMHVKTASEGLETAAAKSFEVCLVDYRLPDMSGIELCKRLRSMGVAIPILMLSSVQSDDVVLRAKAAGANDFIIKHLSYGDTLVAELQRVLIEA